MNGGEHMFTHQQILLGNIFVVFAIGLSFPEQAESQLEKLPAVNKAGESKDATELAGKYIKLARNAIGGEETLAQVQTLKFTGKLNRFVKYAVVQSPTKVVEKEKILSNKLQFELLLPDRFRKRVNVEPLRGFRYSYDLIVNGARAWRNPPLRVMPAKGDRRVVDVDDFERTVAIQALGARQELTLVSLGWMLQALPSFQLEYYYLGRLQNETEQAHVISVRGAEGFLIYLLLDQKTNLPVALSGTFEEERRQQVITEYVGFNRKVWMEVIQRVRKERLERTRPRERYEFRMKFSDYRRVGGVLWPYRLTTTIGEEIVEDFMINNLEINRPIDPKRFEGEPEVKY
jgi:hypothetical protein